MTKGWGTRGPEPLKSGPIPGLLRGGRWSEKAGSRAANVSPAGAHHGLSGLPDSVSPSLHQEVPQHLTAHPSLVGSVSLLREYLGLIPVQQTLPEPSLHARTRTRSWAWRGAQELLVLLGRRIHRHCRSAAGSRTQGQRTRCGYGGQGQLPVLSHPSWEDEESELGSEGRGKMLSEEGAG